MGSIRVINNFKLKFYYSECFHYKYCMSCVCLHVIKCYSCNSSFPSRIPIENKTFTMVLVLPISKWVVSTNTNTQMNIQSRYHEMKSTKTQWCFNSFQTYTHTHKHNYYRYGKKANQNICTYILSYSYMCAAIGTSSYKTFWYPN